MPSGVTSSTKFKGIRKINIYEAKDYLITKLEWRAEPNVRPPGTGGGGEATGGKETGGE